VPRANRFDSPAPAATSFNLHPTDAVSEPSDSSDDAPLDSLFLMACGFELAIGVIGLLLGWAIGPDARLYLPVAGETSVQRLVTDGAVGVAAALPMVAVVWVLMKLSWEPIEQIKRLGDDPMMRRLLRLGRGELGTISLCSGIGEELAFRGWLFPMLVGFSAGGPGRAFQAGDSFAAADPVALGLATVFSSMAFGVLHPITRLYVVITGLMGVYFAALLVVTDSLLVPIVAHASYNAAQFLIAKRETEQTPVTEGE